MSYGSRTSRRIGVQLADPSFRPWAIEEIARAFDEADGVGVAAAEALGVSYRSITRWMREYPKLEEAIRRVREQHGTVHQSGEPFRSQSHRRKP